MSSITIRGCCIGAGRPKVILPIVARTEDDILREARRLSALKADCIEWRADWFSDALDAAARKRVLSGLRAALGEKLLLVTFRTKAEGGEASLTPQQYADFCGTVCVSGCADLLDIEFFPNREGLPALIGQAHKAGVAVVCSSHDFHKTPSRTEMVTRLTAMQQADRFPVFFLAFDRRKIMFCCQESSPFPILSRFNTVQIKRNTALCSVRLFHVIVACIASETLFHRIYLRGSSYASNPS